MAGREKKVVALAGGVGGAKLAHGLHAVLRDGLTVVVNTGDDFRHMGLCISPDLDTVMYTLAGLNNRETGWGLAGETWNFMDQVRRLGGADWFNLGDRDLAAGLLARAGDGIAGIPGAMLLSGGLYWILLTVLRTTMAA